MVRFDIMLLITNFCWRRWKSHAKRGLPSSPSFAFQDTFQGKIPSKTDTKICLKSGSESGIDFERF
jgi:hypothetical protein